MASGTLALHDGVTKTKFLWLTYEHQGPEHHIAVELPCHRIEVGRMERQPLEHLDHQPSQDDPLARPLRTYKEWHPPCLHVGVLDDMG